MLIAIKVPDEIYNEFINENNYEVIYDGNWVAEAIHKGTIIQDNLISRNRVITALNEAQTEWDENYKGLGKAKQIVDELPIDVKKE